MKKIIISLLTLSSIGITNANEKTGDLKSSATMLSTCSISAAPIGFGAVSAPLLAQNAQSEMNVKCNNVTAYTIDLAYGGVYGVGNYTGYSAKLASYSTNYNNYAISNNSGVSIGNITCGYGGNLANHIAFSNMAVANLYGYSTTGLQIDTRKNVCVNGGTQTTTYPVGWSGNWNEQGTIRLGSSYSYGVMNGMSKGDKLAYSISLPGDANKVWNTRNNSYKSIGNGDNQIIPLNAKIVLDKSSSKYLAPDMYLDTITAVISY